MLRQLAPGTRSSEIVPLVYNTLIPKVNGIKLGLFMVLDLYDDFLAL